MSNSPEELLHRIVDAASDAVVFTDRGGVIRYWSPGAAATFGFAADEAIGASLDIIIPERLRDRHWKGWDHVMETGVTRYGREVLAVPAVRKDGSSLSIEFTIQLLRDESGAIAGASAIIRDVTARWQRERDLRARVKELEAKLAAGVAGAGR